jgi:Ca2+:H+ antiporter
MRVFPPCQLVKTASYEICRQFQLVCSGCPDPQYESLRAPWKCDHCYYEHPDPVDDPFYQSTVKDLMFFCAAILLFVSHILIMRNLDN